MADVEDRDRFLELDTGFHVELARASGNALAPLLMEALRETIAERRCAPRSTRSHDWDADPRADRGRPRGARRGDRRRRRRAARRAAVTEHIRGFYELLHAPGE